MEWLRSPGFKRYFNNTGWMFGARIISLAISFLVTAYVTRYLGPQNYGYLSYSVSFVSIFAFIASLGIEQVLYRDLIHHEDKRGVYLGTAFTLKMIAAIIATGLCIISSLAFPSQDISTLLIFVISFTFIFNAFNVITYEFQARVESKYPSIIALVVTILLSLFKIAVVFFHKGIIYFSFILLLESILYAVFYIVYRIKKYGSMKDWKYDGAVAKSLLHDSWPVMCGSAFALIYARIDQIMIKHLIDTSSAGLYDAAVRISEAWYFIPNIIVGSLFPAIINARKTSTKEYFKRLTHLSYFLTVLAIAIAIPTTFFAGFIMKLLYGSAFVGGAGVLRIYIWSGIATSLGQVSYNFLVAENKRSPQFISAFIAMTANVVLNIIFIPLYGIEGSAWATFFSYALVPLSIFLFKDIRHMVWHGIKSLYV